MGRRAALAGLVPLIVSAIPLGASAVAQQAKTKEDLDREASQRKRERFQKVTGVEVEANKFDTIRAIEAEKKKAREAEKKKAPLTAVKKTAEKPAPLQKAAAAEKAPVKKAVAAGKPAPVKKAAAPAPVKKAIGKPAMVQAPKKPEPPKKKPEQPKARPAPPKKRPPPQRAAPKRQSSGGGLGGLFGFLGNVLVAGALGLAVLATQEPAQEDTDKTPDA